MVSLAIEDLSRVHAMLVVPSPRRAPTVREMTSFVSRLAPIEMATASISSSSYHHQANSLAPSLARPALSPAEADQASVLSPKPLSIQGWAIPLVYVACGLVLCLCNVLVPDGITACAHVLAPPWSLALALQAAAQHQHNDEGCLLWLGALVGTLLPFVLLVRDPLFLCFYLLAFAAFSAGRFWHVLQGPPFVLVCVCWFGLATGCLLSVLAEHPRAQLAIASFFALALAITSTGARFGRLVLVVRAGLA
jgi:hypothetical protein